MEFKIDQLATGVRIIAGEEAKQRRKLLNGMIEIAENAGYDEIILPCVEPASVYTDKAGPEILNQMYTFKDKGDRELCLRPEGTATVQLVADKHFKKGRSNNTKLWYFQRCWRYEKPQMGRYREFFQFGIEVINPTSEGIVRELIDLATAMVSLQTTEFEVFESVKRGLSYYVEEGFEITVPKLGAQKQVLGGGRYKQGIGFAIGFDRLMLARD